MITEIKMSFTVLLVAVLVIAAYLIEMNDRGQLDLWSVRNGKRRALARLLVDDCGRVRKNSKSLVGIIGGVLFLSLWLSPI